MGRETSLLEAFREIYGCSARFQPMETITGRAFSKPEPQHYAPITRTAIPYIFHDFNFRELELRIMSQMTKSEPPQGELWFQTKADITRGSDTLARALVCMDAARGRDFSTLVAILKDSGAVEVLSLSLPLPTLSSIVAKFQELYETSRKETEPHVQDQP